MTQITFTRTISIDDWYTLAKENTAPAVTIPLAGSSMRPLIREAIDPVTIIPLQRPLKRGDVVLFTTGEGIYIVHRIWKIRGDCIQTLGDHCVRPDPWISRDKVLGQAVYFSRNNTKHRLDTIPARLWGRMWMAIFPLRKCCLRGRSYISRLHKRYFM